MSWFQSLHNNHSSPLFSLPVTLPILQAIKHGCSANNPRKHGASLRSLWVLSYSLQHEWSAFSLMCILSSSSHQQERWGGKRTSASSVRPCHRHCCWELALFWGHRTKTERGQVKVEQQVGTQGDRNIRDGGKQTKVEKVKKIEIRKEDGNAHSDSTAKHWSRAPPMAALAGCRGRRRATQGKA